MKHECKSDIRNPLGFFEDWITIENIESKFNEYIQKFEDGSDRIDLEKSIYHDINPETGEYDPFDLKEGFQSEIQQLLYDKCQESNRFIDDFYSENQVNKVAIQNFITDKVKVKFKNIIKQTALLEKFPILLKPLEGIKNHIETSYPSYAISDLPKAASIAKSKYNLDLSDKTNKERILIILNFLNFEGINGSRFMSEPEFKLLVDALEELANGKKAVLEKNIKIENLKGNNLLSYVLRRILFPYLSSPKFLLIHLKEFLHKNVDRYEEEKKASTFYDGTLKIPSFKKISDKAGWIEHWLSKNS